ncbi:MAG TPA: inositol monophosphatase family protein [Prolixibacteraceae bacterium]|nr:inositol monophosphatase family protein [Prolixibacteraceae bacterium]
MLNEKDYRQLCLEVQRIAKGTGEFIRGERNKITASDVETKSSASFVTYVDKIAETMIVEALRKLLPQAGYYTEEGTAGNSGEEYLWIIDPLDGTTNYIHGIFPVSVSIGLSFRNEMVVGVVYEIGREELFYAWKGSKAFLNGAEIQVASSEHAVDTLIGTGFPYYDFDRIKKYIEALDELMKHTRGLRRMGSAAADLCYVAAGRYDGFFEHALHAWDVAAGSLIVQQAGGKVTDFNGGDNWLYGGEMVASSSAFYPEFFEIIHRNLGTK